MHRKEVFPVSGYCLSGSAFLSTGIWSLIQNQQHKHCLCVWRNYDTSHLLNCVAFGICPVNSARSHVPLPLDSLTPKSRASTFSSTELFFSYECTLLIETYSTYLFLSCLEFLLWSFITRCIYIGGIYTCDCIGLSAVLLCRLRALKRAAVRWVVWQGSSGAHMSGMSHVINMANAIEYI